ncbi:hypothetical protein [Streptomyces sp. Isolate_219]|nr:hypothetical protein [Streptomyces sp. Isolate_219]
MANAHGDVKQILPILADSGVVVSDTDGVWRGQWLESFAAA